MLAKNKPNEIYITRVYDAPIRAVWEAWTDPKKAAQWWGPRGFSITTHSKDLRVGGHWHYTMHGPDGVDYPNKTKYFEVEELKRLVYDHGGNDEQAPLFRVTVEFSEELGKTKMEMIMALATPEAARETAKFVKEAGGNTTWDRLGEYLSHELSGQELFIINRSFEAPLEAVFQMWVDPKHLARWLPPSGMEMSFLRGEIRPGTGAFYVMSGHGIKMYGRTNYLEITPPDRMVYTQQFCDEHEKVSRHPMAPIWPETMLTKVLFASEGPQQTRITILWQPHGAVTAAEIAAFVMARAGMTQGWTGSFDKLEAALASGVPTRRG